MFPSSLGSPRSCSCPSAALGRAGCNGSASPELSPLSQGSSAGRSCLAGVTPVPACLLGGSYETLFWTGRIPFLTGTSRWRTKPAGTCYCAQAFEAAAAADTRSSQRPGRLPQPLPSASPADAPPQAAPAWLCSWVLCLAALRLYQQGSGAQLFTQKVAEEKKRQILAAASLSGSGARRVQAGAGWKQQSGYGWGFVFIYFPCPGCFLLLPAGKLISLSRWGPLCRSNPVATSR